MNHNFRKAPVIWAIVMITSFVLAACGAGSQPVPTASAADLRSTANAMDANVPSAKDAAPGSEPTAIVIGYESTAEPTAKANTNALCNDGEVLNGPKDVTYALTCVDQLTYDWTYVPGTTKATPDLRHDAQSTGDGKTVTYDVGVNSGEFGIVTGVKVTIGGKTFGNPCALVALAPGYYYQVTISSGRFEVYYMPNSEPRDPDGWSRVLADQAQQKEAKLYQCQNKDLTEIPLLISNLQTGFAP